jgi:transposase InsO family protein
VSPARRREAVEQVQEALDVSERRACEVLGQPRSTQRYELPEVDRDRALVQRIHELVRVHPRYGYRRIWALLRDEGWRINRKKVYRLWRKEGFKVPRKQRKKRRLGTSENGVIRYRAQHINHVWCYDFVKDQTTDGRFLKFFPIEDEYTRECLAIEVDRSITARDVIATLEELFAIRGAPKFIRSDNGPEFIAQAIRDWLAESNVGTLYIEPGAPWENAYIESFNSRFRDELLNREEFTSLLEARVLTDDYKLDYNHRRPHSALDYQTPAAYAASLGGSAPKPPASKPLRKAPGEETEADRSANQDLTLITAGT